MSFHDLIQRLVKQNNDISHHQPKLSHIWYCNYKKSFCHHFYINLLFKKYNQII